MTQETTKATVVASLTQREFVNYLFRASADGQLGVARIGKLAFDLVIQLAKGDHPPVAG